VPVVAATVAGYIYASDAAVVEAYKDYNRCPNDSPRTLEPPRKVDSQALSCMEYGYEPCQTFKVIFSWQQMEECNNIKLIYPPVVKHGNGTFLFVDYFPIESSVRRDFQLPLLGCMQCKRQRFVAGEAEFEG